MRRSRATRKQRTRSYRRELTGDEAAAFQQELQAVAEREALDLELDKAKLLQKLVGTDEQLFALVDDGAELARFADDLEQRGLQMTSGEVQLSLRTSVAFRRAGGRERLPEVGLGHCEAVLALPEAAQRRYLRRAQLSGCAPGELAAEIAREWPEPRLGHRPDVAPVHAVTLVVARNHAHLVVETAEGNRQVPIPNEALPGVLARWGPRRAGR